MFIAEILPRSPTEIVQEFENITEELQIYNSTDGTSDYVNKSWEFAGKLYMKENFKL
jgi:hypothetical protein